MRVARGADSRVRREAVRFGGGSLAVDRIWIGDNQEGNQAQNYGGGDHGGEAGLGLEAGFQTQAAKWAAARLGGERGVMRCVGDVQSIAGRTFEALIDKPDMLYHGD